MIPSTRDLCRLLRSLSGYQHDDVSIGVRAADEIERLVVLLDRSNLFLAHRTGCYCYRNPMGPCSCGCTRLEGEIHEAIGGGG